MRWKTLKAWQRGSVILGGSHLILSILLITTRTEGGGLVLVEIILESPWLLVLYMLGMNSPANLLAYSYIPIVIGTVFYGFTGGMIWQLVVGESKKDSRK